MAPRSFWKGHLKLSLVTCPVAMMPAIPESGKVRFPTLNRATGHRVQSRYIDAETEDPVEADNQVKGYETGENEYITLEDEDLGAVALESTRTIDLEMFVPKDAISWIWYDRPHDLMPDDPIEEEAFSVIRETMLATGMVDPKLLSFVTTLIGEKKQAWDSAMVRDPVQKRLRDIITSKKEEGQTLAPSQGRSSWMPCARA